MPIELCTKYTKMPKIRTRSKLAPELAPPGTSRWIENMDQTIDNILKVYWRRTPSWQLRQLDRMCAFARGCARFTKGYSPGKLFQHVAEIPQGVNKLMIYAFGVEWRNKPDVSERFFKRVAAFRINRLGSMPMTRPEWAWEDKTYERPAS